MIIKKSLCQKLGKLSLELLDNPWTPGAQYLLPRVYIVAMFHIEYKNVGRNINYKLVKNRRNRKIMKFPDVNHL